MKSEMIDTVLVDRKASHGDFKEQFQCAQLIKSILMDYGMTKLTFVQREALDQIAHKISRIVTGSGDFKDHWVDIAGYATLIASTLD